MRFRQMRSKGYKCHETECIYKTLDGLCNYMLVMEQPRGCPADNCDKKRVDGDKCHQLSMWEKIKGLKND